MFAMRRGRSDRRGLACGVVPRVEPLEARVHLSAAPYEIGDPLPAPQRYVVDNVDRLNLRAQLAGSEIGDRLATLNRRKAAFGAQFDRMLLDYVRTRNGPVYDFSPGDVDSIVAFVKNSSDPDQQKLYNAEVLGTSPPPPGVAPLKPVADKATFRETLVRRRVRYEVYNFLLAGAHHPHFTPVQKLPAEQGLYVDWLNPRAFGKLDSTTTAAHLQRLLHLPLTAGAYRFLGTPEYAGTVANVLYTWAGQAPPVSDAALLRLYRQPGTSGYSTEIPAGLPISPAWGALDTGVRVFQLLNTFHLMVNTAAWTPELNTLFMVLMYQHGRVLGETAKAVYVDESRTFGVDANPLGRTDNNKALQLSSALLTMARMFPEFAAARDAGAAPEQMGWKSAARRLLQDAVGRNYRGKYNTFASGGGASWRFDGFHKEQSPGYGQNMADHFIEQLKLSQLNGGVNDPFLKDDPVLRQLLTGEYVVAGADGRADPAAAIPVARRVEALYQIANPDGTAPSLGDVPRPSLDSLFLRAQQVLPHDTYSGNRAYTWPTSYPSLSDVFSLWKKDVRTVAGRTTYGANPVLNRQGRDVTPSQTRPNSPGRYRSWLPGAGYYALRSDKGTPDDVQLTFDVGLMGLPNYNQRSNTAAHTQYDLLNFELYGYGRPLIEDPGLVGYGNSRERNWITSTVAHNSFTVDNYSHARMDGYFGVIGPDENAAGVAVTGYHYGYQGLDVDRNNPNGNGPALARTVWFDKDDTFLIVDWGHQTTTNRHQYKISFTLPKPPAEPGQAAASKAAPVSLRDPRDPSQGVFTQGSDGNVFILPLRYRRRPAAQKVGIVQGSQDAASGAVTGPFVTAPNFTGDAAPADRLFVTQTGNGANFVTLIHTYRGNKNKDQVVQSAIAEIVSQTPSAVTVRITKGGISKEVQFVNPFNANQAPHLSRQPIPTRPTTVPPRSSNPATGGYPDAIEAAEGPAPVDLNAGRFTIGAGDALAVASSASAAVGGSLFSSLPVMGDEWQEDLTT